MTLFLRLYGILSLLVVVGLLCMVGASFVFGYAWDNGPLPVESYLFVGALVLIGLPASLTVFAVGGLLRRMQALEGRRKR